MHEHNGTAPLRMFLSVKNIKKKRKKRQMYMIGNGIRLKRIFAHLCDKQPRVTMISHGIISLTSALRYSRNGLPRDIFFRSTHGFEWSLYASSAHAQLPMCAWVLYYYNRKYTTKITILSVLNYYLHLTFFGRTK